MKKYKSIFEISLSISILMTREAAQSTQDEEIYRTMTIDNSNRGVGNEINAKYIHLFLINVFIKDKTLK